MEGPDTITWEEFVANAEELVSVSDRLADHWLFLGDKKIPGQAYLLHQEKMLVPIDYLTNDDSSSDVEDIVDSKADEWSTKFDICMDPFEAPCAKERPLVTEHHVLWSMSYAVPVIYFNGWKSDYPGVNPVSVEIVQRLLANNRLAYTELSQAMHPLLGRPYLHLHPCGSRHLLRSMSRSTNKLVSWLSAVAPVALNLRLHPDYFRLTSGGESGSGPRED
ncbi:PREDICTED: ubiquitin-like-conjugating enzyme ATG10 [Ceratosolen solmsi marchali]|uniref:Ubiquitin-like-conjugating enzyme ATG10 n=1 Tax=Ceratosolen solmsi marchali TaxID=326594 RepID=A0AAJ7DU64_9HYME|nr:PREDICTED: ubiquitin-like-conjugating enzyme ATG10 [Ceratosolen solmsi marchali]